MISRLVRALLVFVRSLLGRDHDASLPELVLVTPSVAERFGKPFAYPRLEVDARLTVDECVHRLRSGLGRGMVEVGQIDAGSQQSRGAFPLRVRLTGRYRLPGLLQRQVLQGHLDPHGRGTRVALDLMPRSASSEAGELLSAVAIATFVSFVFLTWITGPSDIPLLTIAVVSLIVGAVAGALIQGILNLRGNLKERRRLTRAAARFAVLLDGKVTRWP